jgi:hypothetical protein
MIIKEPQNGISHTYYLGGMNTCEQIINSIFVAFSLDLEIMSLLPHKENLVPTSIRGREDNQPP